MRGFLKIFIAAAVLFLAAGQASAQQRYRSERRIIRGGVEQLRDTVSHKSARERLTLLPDSVARPMLDSILLASDSLAATYSDSLRSAKLDSLRATLPDSLFMRPAYAEKDDEADDEPKEADTPAAARLDSLQRAAADSLPAETKRERRPFISDSMGLSKVGILSAVLPGFGQIYNKQYWKLPILYSTVGASLGMFIHENNRYKPLKRQYDAMTNEGLFRTPELNEVQTKMIRHNTLREVYLGAAIISYLYFIGDAAICYSTNEVSNVKRATTLSTICPGAGQIYNKSYWRVPIVLGGMATTIYCIDWNNRGYQRFKKAYRLRADYDNNPDDYPNGSTDEFGGRYSGTFLNNLRDSYRRNRDLCIILTAGVYLLQIIDAHVDAHLRDFDISDDLTMNMTPMIDCAYSPAVGRTSPTFGMNLSFYF